MTISDLFSMLGGLGLFLYGMSQMRDCLKEAAGGRMSGLLQKMTATTGRGFLAGIVVTAAVQSSSTVTVLLVGLVDAGILTLQQAVGVILGANIGTTVTSQLTAFSLNDYAPLLAFVGVVLLLFSERKGVKQAGGVLAGLGFLFTGLAMMEHAMEPLQKEGWLLSLLTACSNPLTGILAGAVFTGLIQSSAAAVSILQTMARCGMVGINQSMYIVFGQNIGTCCTALLSSAKAGNVAKQTAMLHLWINILGTALFLILCQIFPMAEGIEALSSQEPARQIANIHLIFNVVTSVVLLPFTRLLVRMSRLSIKKPW